MKKNYLTLKASALLLLMGTANMKGQYCNTGLGGSLCSGDNITNVTILGTTLNNNSGCNNPVNGTYTYFAPGVGTTCNLIQGLTYTMSIFTTVSNIESFWIDYNHSNTFDAAEWVQPTTASIANSATTATFTVPMAALTGTTGLRVRTRGVLNINGATDACTSFGSGETEDYIITIIPATPCSAPPAANSVVAPNFTVCPNGIASLGLTTNYTVTGITYQWQQSANLAGPYGAITSATNAYFSPAPVTLTASTYYNAVITCPNFGTITVAAGQITIAATTTNTIPYYESFEGVPYDNKLPNCSWNGTSVGTNVLTYTASNTMGRVPRTGTKFASFYFSPGGSYYFYTNGIYMQAGITYSASVWYQTEFFGYNNFSNFSILYGPTQSTTGLTPIASTNGPAISNIYKSLSNTFQVPTSGLYYVAIGTTVTTASSANYLTWDDLSIIIPCNQVAPNSPTLSILANQTNVCQGSPVNLTASGANTYTWNGGSNLSSVTETPQNVGTTYYTVIGTNTLSGCTSTMTQAVTVNSLPNVFLVASSPSVCSGSQVMLTGLGAMTYTWNNNSNSPVIYAAQTSATTYTVLGSNTNGCVGMATLLVGKYDLPTVGVTSGAPTQMCSGEYVTLTATGNASSFLWTSNTFPTSAGNPILVNPAATTIFTVTGTDAHGCMNKTTIVQNVDMCTGLRETGLTTSKVYPNPTSGVFTIELNSTTAKTITVSDLSGRIVLNTTSTDQKVSMNLSGLAKGVYYVKIQSDKAVEVAKIIKD